MSCFHSATSSPVTLDPSLRVRYSRGMVLGVSDFQQEQLHLLSKDRLHNRLLHGYGTACGLEVTHEGKKVKISPGLALDPKGREIRVPNEQCGDVGAWVDRSAVEVQDDKASVYVVLRHVECETAMVPVPGEPCRTEEEAGVPSRTQESFRIDFQSRPPRQAEEDAVRAFGDLIDAIQIDTAGTPTPIRTLVKAVRDLPAAPPAGLKVKPDDAEAVFRRLFRLWVVTTRKDLDDGAAGCCDGPADAEDLEQRPGVLLARVVCKVNKVGRKWKFVEIAERRGGRRPYLLHTRLLQELVQRRLRSAQSHHELSDLDHGDDHPQYLLVNKNDRSLTEDLKGNQKRIVNLRDGRAKGHALVYGQDTAGDLEGPLPAPQVAGLRNTKLADPFQPTAGQALVFDGTAWAPRAVSGGGGGGLDIGDVAKSLRTLPFATIRLADKQPRGGVTFRAWFHVGLSGKGDEAIVTKVPATTAPRQPAAVVAFVERNATGTPPNPDTILRPIKITGIKAVQSNVFDLTLEPFEDEQVRFVFRLRRITIHDGKTLHQWAHALRRDRPLKWLGHDPGDATVTVPVERRAVTATRPPPPPSPPAGPVPAAAGVFRPDGKPVTLAGDILGAKVFGNLKVRPETARTLGSRLRFTFRGFNPKKPYAIAGSIIGSPKVTYSVLPEGSELHVMFSTRGWTAFSIRIDEIQ